MEKKLPRVISRKFKLFFKDLKESKKNIQVFAYTKNKRKKRKEFTEQEVKEILDLFFTIYFAELLFGFEDSTYFPFGGRIMKTCGDRMIREDNGKIYERNPSILYLWYNRPCPRYFHKMRLNKIRNDASTRENQILRRLEKRLIEKNGLDDLPKYRVINNTFSKKNIYC